MAIEETTGRVGFFCMQLMDYLIRDDKTSLYWDELNSAKQGKCSYTAECPIYKRTVEKQGTQLRLTL